MYFLQRASLEFIVLACIGQHGPVACSDCHNTDVWGPGRPAKSVLCESSGCLVSRFVLFIHVLPFVVVSLICV